VERTFPVCCAPAAPGMSAATANAAANNGFENPKPISVP
jgi:hypothetical protein